jgi:hypothetical protein
MESILKKLKNNGHPKENIKKFINLDKLGKKENWKMDKLFDFKEFLYII